MPYTKTVPLVPKGRFSRKLDLCGKVEEETKGEQVHLENGL